MAEPITPPTSTPAEPAASSVPTTPDGRVYVRTPGGMVSMPAEQVERFVAEGQGHIATPDEVQARLLEREHGEGLGNELAAGAEAAVDTATLGAYSGATRLLGGDAAANAVRERRERNPLAATTGGLVGLGATALATGGTGALGAIARATPAGMALRLGAAAERAVAGTTALSRIGSLTAAGAVEGAVFGLGEGFSEAALSEDQRDRMAEHLMVNLARKGGQGALLGAVGGAAAGTGIEGLRSLASTAKKLADRIGSKAGSILDEGVESGAARARSASANESTTTTSFKLGRPGEERNVLKEFGDAATARNRFDKVHQEATERITSRVSESAAAADEVMAQAHVGLKRAPVAKTMRADPPASLDVAAVSMEDVLSGIRGSVLDAAQQKHLYAPQGLRAFERAAQEIDTITAHIRGVPRDMDDLADAFIGLDRLKRRLGRVQRSAGSGPNGDRGAQAMLREHYEQMRSFLEDGEIWGSGVTQLQKEVNASWSKYLDYASAYEQRFAFSHGLRTTRSASDGFEKIAEADPAKVGSFLRGAGDVEASAAERDLIEGASLQAELLDTLSKHYDVGDAIKAQASKARRNAVDIADELGRVKKVREQAQKWEQTISGLRDVPFVGTMLSGAVTTTAKAAASSEALAGRVAMLARIKASAKDGAIALSQAARKFVEGAARTTKTAAAVAPAMVASRAKDFERVYGAVREYEKDPAAAVRRTYRLQHGIGTVAPMLAAAYAAKTNAAVQFLAEKMPRHEAPASIFERVDETKPPEVDDEQIDTFMRYARAITNPLAVVEDLEAGDLSQESVEALRTVYPGLYQQLQVEILDQVASADEPPPYSVRLSLGILFDLPTDPSLDPEFLSMLQTSAAASAPMDAQAQQPALSPSRRSAPELSGLYETQSASFQRSQ